ncbi:RagB/SusD family nutrient uptake outer membrane protein [Chitinophaga niabensis]|uniref:SusD family protein n=1 Tax=Chitinophaga niabensis TaxID=536979 RepID=A0A1N6JBL1_9BACT|nr:RagB/SusD family nutrient uptake outer membrane protein [Chitinophaga niabensis]SIO41742.1 SusD family protein [Chitinophaga niabensis]
MNRKVYKNILLIVLSTLLFSCGKDFLNFPTNETIIRDDYVKDLSTLNEFLNGVYLTSAREFGGTSVLYPEIVADNIKPAAGVSAEQAPFGLHYTWSQYADEPFGATKNLNSDSYALYSIVAGCNFVIEKVAKYRQENEDNANLIEGQALALRAMAYSYLLNYFSQAYSFTGDASHVGVAINNSIDFRALPTRRNTVAEVFDFMINDLKRSVLLLPPASGSTYMINRNAAKGLLARVLLAKGDYGQARQYAKEVLQLKPIMTQNYPAALFTPQETEALFQLSQSDKSLIIFSSYYLRGSIFLQATSDIASLYFESPTDVRRAWVTKSATGWTVTKYPQGVVPVPSTAYASIGYTPTLLRSSEMCLILAESYAKMGDNYVDSARFFLDAIRKRADLNAKVSNASGAALLDSIYKERRKELSFEGFRMFDLMRWKQGVNRTDVTNPQYKQLPYPSDKAIAPIPLRDVQLAKLLQNSGY